MASPHLERVTEMQIYVKGIVMAKLTAKGTKRLKYCSANGLCTVCLKPLEEGTHVVRGAHYPCYFRIYRKIRSGAMTDQQAMQEGLLRQHDTAGRKPIAVPDLPEGVK